jgi:hypothetical protein
MLSNIVAVPAVVEPYNGAIEPLESKCNHPPRQSYDGKSKTTSLRSRIRLRSLTAAGLVEEASLCINPGRCTVRNLVVMFTNRTPILLRLLHRDKSSNSTEDSSRKRSPMRTSDAGKITLRNILVLARNEP